MQIRSKSMNLSDFADGQFLYGSQSGKQTYWKLLAFIEANPEATVFVIAIDRRQCVDVSFAREAVAALAKRLRGEKGICLSMDDERVSDNWTYGARAIDQPLTVWAGSSATVIGPKLSSSNQQLIEYVLDRRVALASEAAKAFGISQSSASARLKRLADDGYCLRQGIVAPTGGIEYEYHAIH